MTGFRAFAEGFKPRLVRVPAARFEVRKVTKVLRKRPQRTKGGSLSLERWRARGRSFRAVTKRDMSRYKTRASPRGFCREDRIEKVEGVQDQWKPPMLHRHDTEMPGKPELAT